MADIFVSRQLLHAALVILNTIKWSVQHNCVLLFKN